MSANLLGDWLNPEMFLSFSESDCPFDDSIKAYNYFVNEREFAKDIAVFPVEIVALGDALGSHLFWAAFDVNENMILSFLPAFYIENYEEFVENHDFPSINLLEKDRFFIWKDTFCALIFTSARQVVVRKVNGIWSYGDANALISYKMPELVCPDIYPVELFSNSEHKFVCSAWAVEDAEKEMIFWYPIQWSDEEVLNKYEADDLSEIPLNIGDVTKAGEVKLEMLYSHQYGVYFAKTNKELPSHITSNQYCLEALNEECAKKLYEANLPEKSIDGEANFEQPLKTCKEIKFEPKIREPLSSPSSSKVISMFAKS